MKCFLRGVDKLSKIFSLDLKRERRAMIAESQKLFKIHLHAKIPLGCHCLGTIVSSSCSVHMIRRGTSGALLQGGSRRPLAACAIPRCLAEIAGTRPLQGTVPVYSSVLVVSPSCRTVPLQLVSFSSSCTQSSCLPSITNIFLL